jgi:hypothetical protein
MKRGNYQQGSSAGPRYNLNLIVQASVEAGTSSLRIGINYWLNGVFEEYENGDRWKADRSRLGTSFLKGEFG